MAFQNAPNGKCGMWQAAGGMPRLITKGQVYPTGPEHSDEGLFEQFLTLESSRVRVFIDGIEDFANAKKKRTHLAGMAYRHGQNGRLDHFENFRITATAVLDGDQRFHIPRIDGDAVPQYPESTEVIWVTSGGYTPKHIGRSASRLKGMPLKSHAPCNRSRKTCLICLRRSMPEDIPIVAAYRAKPPEIRPKRIWRLAAIRLPFRNGRRVAGRCRLT